MKEIEGNVPVVHVGYCRITASNCRHQMCDSHNLLTNKKVGIGFEPD